MSDSYADRLAQYASALQQRFEDRYAILTHLERTHRRKERFVPHGSVQYRLAHKGQTVLRTLHTDGLLRGSGTLLRALRGRRPLTDRSSPDAAMYQSWFSSQGSSHEKLLAYGAQHAKNPDAPLISIVLPTYKSDLTRLRAALRSVMEQAYTKWELLIVDDASQDPSLLREIESVAVEDPRVHVHVRGENGGIAVATQDGLAMASGTFVTFLDHDDALLPFALSAVVEAVNTHPDGDVLYSDEIVIGEDGATIIDVALKPGFSPHLLLATNYICHLLVIRRTLLTSIGGMHQGYDGSQDYDLILRATEASREVVHIPEVLYLWNEVPGSVITGTDAKPYAYEAGRRALAAALERRHVTDLTPEHGEFPGWYAYTAHDLPHISIVIPDIFPGNSCSRTIAAIHTTTQDLNMEICVVRPHGNGALSIPGADAVIEASPAVSSLPALLNAGEEACTGEFVVFMAPGVIPTTRGWLRNLLSYLLFPDVGACAPRILSHTGIPCGDRYIIPGNGTLPVLLADSHWPLPREVSALAWSCLAVRSEALQKVGGFNSDFFLSWFDADLAFQLRHEGYAVLSIPTVTVHTLHLEGVPFPAEEADGKYLLARHPHILGQIDPFLHPAVIEEKPFTFRM